MPSSAAVGTPCLCCHDQCLLALAIIGSRPTGRPPALFLLSILARLRLLRVYRVVVHLCLRLQKAVLMLGATIIHHAL